ncbi:NAD(P)-dependent oxidoreductase [Herbaspirillum sp. C7C8]|jgi:3-hydroxyisobutyrate dehydrogenase|uniref:NAD(P)-dependent oxidoreductase n=1 Tax=Herbaspirillum sp. C7C8 TaxID=2736665 RepID=UPI001F51C0BA|nr:NAD(P)-dependent oxidoreductase [Herbaspirillum sp. C7C8]MCI1005128.1 NAD(P)-dependent oxidoreductase [Herbaspirillum sp. C7C8]
MSRIAVLGLGAMGSRMAANWLKAGHEVTVWNRTAAAGMPLAAAGARLAATPREAAQGAQFVIAMLRDDAASRDVWLDPAQGALAALGGDAIAIESSTLTPQWVRTLGQQVSQSGAALLEAPVSGSRPQAEAGQLVYLIGGEAEVLERVRPLLQVTGGAIHHVGSLGQGALAKLATNALLGIQVAALAEIIALLEAQGADVPRTLAAMSGTSAWAPVAGYLSSAMLSSNHAPQFPISLIEKDFAYTLQLATSTQQAPALTAALEVFSKARAEGLGEQNMTAVIELARAAGH